MTDEKMPDDEFMERAAEISMEWFNITPVARALEAEYQRGMVDGGLAVNAKFSERLAAEHQRGMDDYRDELLRNMDARRVEKEPIVKGLEETSQEKPAEPGRPSGTPEPPKRTSEPPAAREKAPKQVRGDTGPRPEGIPTTFEMIGSILDGSPGLTAQQVGDRIRECWWPGMDFKRIGPEFSTWIRKGRLDRDADGKLTLTEQGRKVAFPVGFDPNKKSIEESRRVLPPDPPKVRMPAVQPTAGPRPETPKPPPMVRAPDVPRQVVTPGAKLGPPVRSGHAMAYQHGGKSVMLHHREFSIAQVLRAAMGKGHIDTTFLAQKALGSDKRNAIDNESLLRDLVSIMNPKLEPLRLNIEFHKGFGFVMKELA